MSVAIVDYGSGNLRSAATAIERMAGPSEKILVTDDVARQFVHQVPGQTLLPIPKDR